MDSPLLSAYYGSIGAIDQYYKSQMEMEVVRVLGKDFSNILEEYYGMNDTYGMEKDAKAFYKKHKAEFQKYYEIKDAWQAKTNNAIAAFSAHIPDVNAKIRKDYNSMTAGEGAKSLVEGLTPQREMTALEWQQLLSPEVMRLIADHLMNNTALEYDLREYLDDLAKYTFGYYDADELIQAVGKSLYSFQP